jgi:hypothetical protein
LRLGPSTSGQRSGGYEARAGSAPRAHAVLTIFEEDKRYLEVRVARLDTGMAWAEIPHRAPVTCWKSRIYTAGERRGAAKTALLVSRSHQEWKWRRRMIALDANVLLEENPRPFL